MNSAEERLEKFRELERIEDSGDLATFWERWADYLEWDGAISNMRRTLVRAARATSERLRK